MALLARRQKALAGYSDYDEKWVKAQLNAGNQFTYYGGKPLDQQVKKYEWWKWQQQWKYQ